MPHNKLIEEKVAAFAAFQLGTFENGLHVPITREQQDEWLHTALADLLATRDAQMIEVVEKLRENKHECLHAIEEEYDWYEGCPRDIQNGMIDTFIQLLRPQQQEEVSN